MLEISVCIVQGVTVVDLRGALVRGEADRLVQLVEWLQEFGERRIAVHAAALTTVDTHGVIALVRCHSVLSGSGGCLLVRMPSARLRGALRRTGLDRVLPIEEPQAGLGDGAVRHA